MPRHCPPVLAAALAAAAGALLVACTSPGWQPIVGPDGSPMAHVHCGSEQGVCFRIAGEVCPSGYDIKPVLSGRDGNFLVRCRAPRAVAQVTQVAASCPLPAPVSTPPGLMYPWPPPGAGSAARATQSAPGQSAEIDLGY